jgi:hypothetical protein
MVEILAVREGAGKIERSFDSRELAAGGDVPAVTKLLRENLGLAPHRGA